MRDKYSIRHFYARQNTGLDWTVGYSIQREITLKEIFLATPWCRTRHPLVSSRPLSRENFIISQAWNGARICPSLE